MKFDFLSFCLGGWLGVCVYIIVEFVLEKLFGDDETKR